ncbi:MAG: hypothetical protein HY527_00450 [Betaproteobacteria bacterium]|nr:hypothetical protein [Betaproteobacteria bacterium]
MTGDATYKSFDIPLELETVDLGDILGASHRNVMTDGLPVVKPSRADVEAMLAGRGRNVIVAALPPVMGECTHERLAALAVLAGCPVSCFPVLVAAVQAVARDEFNLLAVQTTTGNVAVAVLVSGPGAPAMGLHAGSNGLGPGPRANVTIGRALRLALMNIGGAIPGLLDVSCLGWPGKLSFCTAEHTAASPWPPFHLDRGFRADATVVTAAAAYGFIETADAVSTTVEPLLSNLCEMMGAVRASGSRGSQVLVLLTPQHAHTLAQGGLGRHDVQAYLHERIFALDRHVDAATGKAVRMVSTPEDVLLVVTGGNGGKSAFVPLWSGSRAVSVAVS